MVIQETLLVAVQAQLPLELETLKLPLPPPWPKEGVGGVKRKLHDGGGVGGSEGVTLWCRLPDEPVRVTENVPVAAVEEATRVRVEEAVPPGGGVRLDGDKE